MGKLQWHEMATQSRELRSQQWQLERRLERVVAKDGYLSFNTAHSPQIAERNKNRHENHMDSASIQNHNNIWTITHSPWADLYILALGFVEVIRFWEHLSGTRAHCMVLCFMYYCTRFMPQVE